ncbi:MAG: SIR2 family protein [Lachnospiraceae bacterium]|nr:SIR2 family protein [Lachnospiraceae bacterium]
MDIEHLDIYSEIFDGIVEEIKRRNLSTNFMPKLIIGTGLSIVYGVPGMNALAKHLDKEIKKSKDASLKEKWNERFGDIKNKGLEAGLANLSQEELGMVDTIKVLTAKYILKSEEKIHEKVLEKDTGFCRLMRYLSGTVSNNNRIIDIMTPNYDRIIELVCDKLGIGVITGFSGNMYCRFDRNLLRQPGTTYHCRSHTWVRLFKPHGSINWISKNGKEYQTNNYNVLSKNAEYIEIVTPGSSKYREGMINNTFRCMREEFNDLLNPEEQYSLLFYGYGFNDDHFDTALFDSFQKNVLILAKDVKEEVKNKALTRKNITIFYHENGKDYMIYNSKKYSIDLPLWDIDQFADIFIA